MKKHIYKIILILVFLPICHGSYAQTDDEWREKVNKNLAIVESEWQSKSEISVEYLFALDELVELYYSAEQYYDAIKYGIELDSIHREFFAEPSSILCRTVTRVANAYSKLGDHSVATKQQLNLISLDEYVYNNGGKTFDDYSVTLSMIVEDYRVLAAFATEDSNFLLTKMALKYAIKLMEENDIVDSCHIPWNIYGRMVAEYCLPTHTDNIDIDSAIYYKRKECAIYERQLGKTSAQYRDNMFVLEGFYYDVGRARESNHEYYEAARAFSICDSIFKMIGDDTSRFYFLNLLNISSCFSQLGAIDDAISQLEYIEPIIEEKLGRTSGIYQLCLSQLISLYTTNKDTDKQILLIKKRIALFEQDSSMSEISYVDFLNDVAMTYENQGAWDSAEIYYLKEVAEIEKNTYTHSLDLIAPLCRLLKIYDIKNDAERYDSIAQLCNQILTANENNPQINQYHLLVIATLAPIASKNRWEEAEEYWWDNIILSIQNQYDNNIYFLEALVEYVYEAFFNGHTPDSLMQNALIGNNMEQYYRNFANLSVKERETIVEHPLYQSIRDIVFSLTNDNSNLMALYDYSLFCKQQTLTTDIEFAKSVYGSEDNELIAYYTDIKEQQGKESAYDERWVRAQSLQHGGNDWMTASYDSVKNSIGDKDIAVEYVNYYDYSNIAADYHSTERYIALIVRKDWVEPRYIPLCKADDLKKYTSLTSDKIYGGGYVSEEIVHLLFDPIKEYTKKNGHVYFSPDGVLYNLAIENILTEDSMTLGEKYGLVRCSSTRNIAQINNHPKYASAVLYGGLDYGNGTDYVAEATTRKGWNYLPGTLQEVSTISKVLNQHKVKTEIFTGKEGTEDSFAQLSGRRNPIIHLATHGFFYTSTESKRETYFDNLRQRGLLGDNQSQTEEISPMQRSGLLLSNGNKTWMSEKESAGSEDGVLLASEVMNMNLFGTNLLVLSACETGLGDMSVEGIMGLQRAFKLAGVNTIVMSLWKVDDKATAMMMEQFYKNLMSGKNKRKAFSLAQQKVRKAYPTEPWKWAAFIMLD